MFESQQGNIYADNSGAVYVLSPSENRITLLNNGKSVVLNEIMMYQAAKGMPQRLEQN